MQNNQFIKLVLVMAASALLSACGAGPNGEIDLPSNTGSDRLAWVNEPLVLDRTGSTFSAPSTGGPTVQAVTVSLSLNLIGTLTPPIVNGSGTYATSVVMNGTKAYVSYNTPGVTYGGGIDVIETLVPTLPILSSSLIDNTNDFSQLLVSGSNLYSAGAKDTGLIDTAVINKFPLTLGNLSGAPTTQIIPGYVGVGVTTDGTNLYAASGNNGGLSIMDPATLGISSSVPLDGARDIKMRSGNVEMLTGKTASTNPLIKTYLATGALSSTSGTMPNAVIDEAKSTLVSGTYFHLATAGEGGTNLVCASNGTLMNTIPNPVVSGLTTAQTAANAAVFYNGLIYVANGGAGIYVYSVEQQHVFPDCNVNIAYVGKISLPDGASINNVMIANGYLIAATGASGFKIISITQGLTLGLLSTL